MYKFLEGQFFPRKQVYDCPSPGTFLKCKSSFKYHGLVHYVLHGINFFILDHSCYLINGWSFFAGHHHFDHKVLPIPMSYLSVLTKETDL